MFLQVSDKGAAVRAFLQIKHFIAALSFKLAVLLMFAKCGGNCAAIEFMTKIDNCNGDNDEDNF